MSQNGIDSLGIHVSVGDYHLSEPEQLTDSHMDSVSGNCDYHSFLLVHAAHLQLRGDGGVSFVAVMIQEDYHSQNPYHNAVHAADVTQAMHCYLREPKVRR